MIQKKMKREEKKRQQQNQIKSNQIRRHFPLVVSIGNNSRRWSLLNKNSADWVKSNRYRESKPRLLFPLRVANSLTIGALEPAPATSRSPALQSALYQRAGAVSLLTVEAPSSGFWHGGAQSLTSVECRWSLKQRTRRPTQLERAVWFFRKARNPFPHPPPRLKQQLSENLQLSDKFKRALPRLWPQLNIVAETTVSGKLTKLKLLVSQKIKTKKRKKEKENNKKKIEKPGIDFSCQ